MSSFTNDLTITKVKIKVSAWRPFSKNKFKHIDMWRVDEQFDYHVGCKDSDEVIHIKKGTITDGASIPKFAWIIVGHPLEEYAQAAVLHDEMYRTHMYARIRCDAILYEAMGVLKVAKWKRITMHQAVRRFGWISWKNRKR